MRPTLPPTRWSIARPRLAGELAAFEAAHRGKGFSKAELEGVVGQGISIPCGHLMCLLRTMPVPSGGGRPTQANGTLSNGVGLECCGLFVVPMSPRYSRERR